MASQSTILTFNKFDSADLDELYSVESTHESAIAINVNDAAATDVNDFQVTFSI